MRDRTLHEKKEEDRRLDHEERVGAFVKALAEFLVGNQSEMSIKLQMGRPEAMAWQKLRATTPLFGYPTVGEAEKELAKFFGVEL